MAQLPQAMEMIRAVFDKYAKNKKTLQKEQVAKLLREEFNLGSGDNGAADEMFQMLDNDNSGTVDFQEFVTFVASLCLVISEDP